MKPQAATYARVSLPGQKENFSLPSQRDSMLKLAREKGYDVPPDLQFVDEGLLGGEADRPAFVKLRETIRSGRIKAVFCHDLDRLIRGLSLQMLVMEEAEKYGVALEFVTMPVEKSAEGRMLLQMRGVFAEYEKFKIRERTTRGRKQQAEMGFRPSGRPPYGYVYRGSNAGSRGELVIDEKQAAVVRRMFNMAEDGATTGAIARALNEDGILPQSARSWAKEVIAQMLRRTVYMGVGYYNRSEQFEPAPERRRKDPRPGHSKRTAKKFRAPSEWIEIAVPAIIEPAQFERVRQIMQRTHALHVGRPSRKYLLRGLVRCARCGRSMAVNPNRDKPRYRCGNFNRLDSSERYCTATATVSVRAFEESVWLRLREVYSSPERLELEYRLAKERENRGRKESEREAAALRKTIDKLKTRESRTTHMMLDEDLADVRAQIRADLQRTMRQRRDTEERLASLVVHQPVFEMTNLDRECRAMRKLMTAAQTFEEKREVLTRAISRIDVDAAGESEIHLRVGGGPAEASPKVINRKFNQSFRGARDPPIAGDGDSRRDWRIPGSSVAATAYRSGGACSSRRCCRNRRRMAGRTCIVGGAARIPG
jgi:site-specific DNA recombinase